MDEHDDAADAADTTSTTDDAAPDDATPARAMSEAFLTRPSDEEIREIEQERERRLAPENRPEGAEVDNTGENMPDFVHEELSE